MASWWERSREYHNSNRRSVEGSAASYTGTRSASPDEFQSSHQSTLAPSVGSYSDHYRKRTAVERIRGAPPLVWTSQENEPSLQSLKETTTARERPRDEPTRPSPLAASRHDTLEERVGLEWGRGVHTAAQLARTHASWEQEKASLIHSRDTLEASLQRERCMRNELEDQLRAVRAENQSLKSSLAKAIGSPLRGRSAPRPGADHAASTQRGIDTSARAAQDERLCEILSAYDGMLRDLQQLQSSARAAQTFSHYPITLHDLRDWLPQLRPPHSGLVAEPTSSDNQNRSESPSLSCRLELEQQAETSGKETAAARAEEPVASPLRTRTDDTTVLLSPPPSAAADQEVIEHDAPASPAHHPPAAAASLSPPPPFMRSVTRSPPSPSMPQSQPTPWRGPMHRYQSDHDSHGCSSTADGGVDSSVARPLYRSAPTVLEREEAILETDKLAAALAVEVAHLAEEHEARDAPAVAALCAERGLDYVDVQFPPITSSLGAGGCRVLTPGTNAAHTIQFQHIDAVLPPGRRAELVSSAGLDPCAVEVGLLNNRGVASGLAALAEASGAVMSVLASTTAEDEENRLTRVWVCAGGLWTLVDVDGYLPIVQDGTVTAKPQFYGCANRLTFDLWPAMCEKALAKVLGSYRATAGLDAASTLGLLTGGPVELWDWWRERIDVAFDEIEAAINTTARGSGIVLLTTHSSLSSQSLSRPHPLFASHDDEPAPVSGESPERLSMMHAVGLAPSTSYRVLAAAEDEAGQRMLLLRIWEAGAKDDSNTHDGASGTTTATPRHRRLSPLRTEPLDDSDSRLHQVGVAAHGDGASCAWLPLHSDIATLFEQCHVCFDCRRFHDVRLPIPFRGHDPCSPDCVVRVNVRRPPYPHATHADCPARLWIGLHQPLSHDATAVGCLASSSSLDYCGLKMALLVPEIDDGTPQRRSLTSALAGPPVYSLSESFGGHFQSRPSVWMYLEMEAFADSTVTFYIIPQLDPSNDHNLMTRSSSQSRSDRRGAPPSRFTALALLAEDKDLFDVELLSAPPELSAALCHGGLECLDLSSCEPFSRGTETARYPQAQVNGRRVTHFEW